MYIGFGRRKENKVNGITFHIKYAQFLYSKVYLLPNGVTCNVSMKKITCYGMYVNPAKAKWPHCASLQGSNHKAIAYQHNIQCALCCEHTCV